MSARVREIKNFLNHRPEYKNGIGTLLRTVADCVDHHDPILATPLEQCHEHVWGRPGAAGCDRCRRDYQMSVAHLRLVLAIE